MIQKRECDLAIGDVFSFEKDTTKYKIISPILVLSLSTNSHHAYQCYGSTLVWIHGKKYPQRKDKACT